MRNFLLLISTIALFAFAACTGSRLKVRTLQVDTASFDKLKLMIPKLFWVDQSGSPGDKFVAFRSRNNTHLSCNPQGELILDQHLNKTEFWTPEILDDKKVSLKWMNGKYLGQKNEIFRCDVSKNDAARIKFELNPKLSGSSSNSTDATSNVTSSDKNQTIALRLDRGYLGYLNNKFMIVPELILDSVFMPPIVNATMVTSTMNTTNTTNTTTTN